MKPVAPREAVGLLRAMTWVLCAVGILALIFTTVNVTRFATSHHVPLPIAILLDPMLGTALAGVLYVDARLASWGIRPPAWSTALRWGAGCTAALMNTWESLWPDGRIGWPRRADPAAVLLHLTPALLLIALTETIAAYRRTVTDLLGRIGPEPPGEPGSPLSPAQQPPAKPAGPPAAGHDPGADREAGRPPDRRSGPALASATNGGAPREPDVGDDAADTPSPGPTPQSAGDGPTDTDVWPRAVALNDAARAATGKPASIWRLRTDLRIGPRRARQIHEQLQAHPSDPPPPAG
ncbi:extensin [Streptomyces sp. Ru87]|uniref:extensin n=1 Tax=Streptomyces sp. Ru87 TaxID=2044307 RepID=UPI000BF7BE24|nr:extensin [Streptomyces sp. Ru87]PGH46727.1 extensin [Streptomyces sp. Ru87]